jgi:carboxypeptidase PM20D1
MSDSELGRLQRLLRVQTVDYAHSDDTGRGRFDAFTALLVELYPRTHSTLERETVGEASVLYQWKGRSDQSPTVLMAHFDVVPATDEGWIHPPFAATVVGEGVDRLIWGRGSLDDKGALAAILEAVERRCAAGFVPEHDVYLSFGHDEETVGSGAKAVVALLAERGVRPAVVLDEGGAIVRNVFPGVDAPIAVVGVSEKGEARISLIVEQQGGHASTPPRVTAPSRLARAITRLEARPFPVTVNPTTVEMIRIFGEHNAGLLGVLMRRAKALKPVLGRIFARMGDETNAIVRTTLAVTQLSGSQASNVLAERATASLNIRIAVGSSVDETIDHVRRAVRDPLVRVELDSGAEPSPVSPSSGSEWRAIEAALAISHPDAVITPYVMLAASDSKYFARISDCVYRFSPFEMTNEERATLHARNERLHVEAWLRGIDFYQALLGSR